MDSSCVCFSVCVTTVPSSSSGATRLAANFSTAPTRFADPSTTSFTAFAGSEAILLRPPGGGERQQHPAVQPPSWSQAPTTVPQVLFFSNLGLGAVEEVEVKLVERVTVEEESSPSQSNHQEINRCAGNNQQILFHQIRHSLSNMRAWKRVLLDFKVCHGLMKEDQLQQHSFDRSESQKGAIQLKRTQVLL